ncbi:DUF418 domain-containing protein [Peribacillus kribbensis]|uniref:DUF418 domain-containing protein n=1 Tax=Peribacillus kribbensis TaxID=356658 RepID=UPI000407927B|nr:DUF418 domain-containing protein [Peribacillus kribbensis]
MKAPLSERDRIVSIDILRGFSLLGIFFVNMQFFHSMMMPEPLRWWTSRWDRILYIFLDLTAQASFYPLFAFLFGFSAILMEEGARKKGFLFPSLFARRLTMLLIFGCIHAFLIWHGDILINYALFGFLLLLFYKKDVKYLMTSSLLLSAVLIASVSAGFILAMAAGVHVDPIQHSEAEIRHGIEVYQQGSYKQIFHLRFKEWYEVNNPGNLLYLFLSIFPLFLAGAAFAKAGWLSRPEEFRGNLRKVCMISLPVGFALKLLPYVFTDSDWMMFLQDNLGGPMVSIGYITGGVLLLRRKGILKLFYPFSFVGRLSLSNYLAQSILCTSIFYSYGLGMFGKVTIWQGSLLVILIYTLQVTGSWLWLKKYRIGPLEFLWRYGTYGKRPILKRRT